MHEIICCVFGNNFFYSYIIKELLLNMTAKLQIDYLFETPQCHCSPANNDHFHYRLPIDNYFLNLSIIYVENVSKLRHKCPLQLPKVQGEIFKRLVFSHQN